MSKLDRSAQLFVVQLLGQYSTPSRVAKAVKEIYDIEITRQSVEWYDPTKNPNLDEELVEAFNKSRAEVKSGKLDLGILHANYRLAVLQKLVDGALDKGQGVLAAKYLEQAAREVGGAFTNKRELTGSDGGELVIKVEYVNPTND